MSSQLEHPVTAVKLIGEHRQKALAEIGIHTLGQLLDYYPRKYLDRSHIAHVKDLVLSEHETTIVGTVVYAEEIRTRRGKSLLVAGIEDETDVLQCKWFQGITYWKKQLIIGETVAVSGKISEHGAREFIHPAIDRLGEDGDRELLNTGRIVSLYHGTLGLRKVGLESSMMRRVQREVLTVVSQELIEYLPQDDLVKVEALPRAEAMEQIHFPESHEKLAAAWRRIRYEELFFFQLLFATRKYINRNAPGGVSFDTVGPITKKVLAALPFELTEGQKQVLSEIRRDLQSPHPMQRLLHGEVGAGKTTVALLAMAMAADSGFQSVMMAPTELLALQHARSVLEPATAAGLRVRLVRGKLKTGERKEILASIASGQTDIVIGTHAVLNENVRFPRLGLVIIDEQHRFGVEQRAILASKGMRPHLLVMTATPIPRTMRLSLIGDLDVSTLKELPNGKRDVRTVLRTDVDREKVYAFIINETNAGRKVFIVCPLVEESENVDTEAAIDYHKRVSRGALKSINVGLLHGRQSADEKEKALASFRSGATPVLIATPVVEVGVDMPDATVMVVENAERFGLAALHQLRGRIGRKGQKAWFILLPGPNRTPEAQIRLQTLVETDDGFEIAERDLRLRGAGEFFGTRQSGEFDLRYADPVRDEAMLLFARDRAFELIESDPHLDKFPSLQHHFRARHAHKLDYLSGG